MSMRLRLQERLQGSAPAFEPYSLHIPSSSFSSFSSSNLDTESSASFFQDDSVSLGKLIGYRPRERGSLYFQNTIRGETGACASKEQSAEGICIPLILKMSRNRSKSKQLDV
ncbi:hypothetical protein PTKIN_Ptkin01aG0114400 [Pterospermum kingtungense]